MQATAQYYLFSEKPIADPATLIQKLASFGTPPNAPLVWQILQDNWAALLDAQGADGYADQLITIEFCPALLQCHVMISSMLLLQG